MKIAIEGTSLRNRLSDSSLEHLMKIAIEGTSLRNRLSDSGLEHLMKIAIEGTSLLQPPLRLKCLEHMKVVN